MKSAKPNMSQGEKKKQNYLISSSFPFKIAQLTQLQDTHLFSFCP